MFARSFFGGRYYGPRYWGDGGAIVVVVAETPSGGWVPRRPAPFYDESDTAREARIKAERVRLGILPAEPSQPSQPSQPAALDAAGAAITGVPATLASPDPSVFDAGALDSALALDLAELYSSAYLDQEIRRFFELQDDEDAAVLLLAIAATLH